MLRVATHSGPFHADDVLAYALLRAFLDEPLELVRSRDAEVLRGADVVFDVGGELDPARGRFDHHQASYEGPLSSAGLILAHLEAEGRVRPDVAAMLRRELVDYVDDVDNGRREPLPGTLCFTRLVEAMRGAATSTEAFDVAYLEAAEIAEQVIGHLLSEHETLRRAEGAVIVAMRRAVDRGDNLLELEEPLGWKDAYFEHGGSDHPTELLLMPGSDGSWRVVAIPAVVGSFRQKRSLPEAWAGLMGAELEARTGVPGSLFCHKNRFIAVFTSREAALEALRRSGLLRSVA